jgi:uncharacterized membrane protein YtjA (UPF0391 family)
MFSLESKSILLRYNIGCVKSEIIYYSSKSHIMLTWIVIALLGAFVFALLGFTGIARGFAAIAKILFYIFLIVLVITLIAHLL